MFTYKALTTEQADTLRKIHTGYSNKKDSHFSTLILAKDRHSDLPLLASRLLTFSPSKTCAMTFLEKGERGEIYDGVNIHVTVHPDGRFSISSFGAMDKRFDASKITPLDTIVNYLLEELTLDHNDLVNDDYTPSTTVKIR